MGTGSGSGSGSDSSSGSDLVCIFTKQVSGRGTIYFDTKTITNFLHKK